MWSLYIQQSNWLKNWQTDAVPLRLFFLLLFLLFLFSLAQEPYQRNNLDIASHRHKVATAINTHQQRTNVGNLE